MKKFLIFSFVLSFLFVACNSNKNEKKEKTEADATPLQTTKDVNAPNIVSLKYNLEKGKKYTFLLTTEEKSSESIKADTSISQNLSRKQTLKITFEVLNIDTDGSLELNSTINNIKISMSDGRQTVSFDSDKDANKTAEFGNYLAMVNNSFGVRITSNGDILEITKVDKLVKKLLEYLGKQIPADKKNEFINYSLNSLKMQLSQIVNQIYKPLPNKQIGVDSTWSISTPSKIAAFDVITSINYKVLSFEKLGEDRLLKYGASLSNKITGKNRIVENGNEFRFDKPEITGNNTTYFNLTKGCIQKSISNLSTSSSMSILPKGGKFQIRSTKTSSSNIVEFLGIEN